MRINKKLVRKQRKFSDDFKRQIVKDFEGGSYSVPQLARLHNIAFQTIYDWIYKYSQVNERGYRVVEMSASTSEKVKALEAKIKQLERIVGKKQIAIDYLEALIETAKEELNIDIKKKFDTPPSKGSESEEAS